MNKIRILTVRFGNEISRREIPLFRGAVINAVAQWDEADVLFHNHEDDNRLRYSYPLIQYKRINRKAAIVCVADGTETIGRFFSACNFDVKLGERETTLAVETMNADQYIVQVWDSQFKYRIRKWLPLNKENYEIFNSEESLVGKYAMLEKIMTANILSFAKGVGIRFDKEVECKLTAMAEPTLMHYKGVKMMAFDADFTTNVSLPDFIGLGKGVSLGYGVIVRRHEKDSPITIRKK